MNIDLHCHSNVSDGALPPAEVARRAARAGVEVWALTDHDQLGGLDEAREAARAEGMRFVDGVEISVTWRGSTVHVVGLRIDPAKVGDARIFRPKEWKVLVVSSDVKEALDREKVTGATYFEV